MSYPSLSLLFPLASLPSPSPPLVSSPPQEGEVGSKELKELQARNNEFQSRVDALERKCEEGEERLLVQTQRHREEIRGLSDKLKQESAAVEAQYKVGGGMQWNGDVTVTSLS